ncbi:hypothetical protein G7054_g2066 [Neopestalotiopsis clavispora]|nr:hypothetical protein G7054_g2066 [Neopestalotiopsis clavispora]
MTLPKEEYFADDRSTDTLLFDETDLKVRWSFGHGEKNWRFWDWKTKNTKYEGLAAPSSNATCSTMGISRSRKSVILSVIAIILLVGYVLATAPLAIQTLLAQRRYTCGNSLEEAKARGCTFDPMTVQWLPKQCSRAGVDEFLSAHGTHTDFSTRPAGAAAAAVKSRRGEPDGSTPYPDQNATERVWRYYRDEAQTQEYVNGLIDAPIGHYQYYTTRGEHLAHCAYILVRGAEAREPDIGWTSSAPS